MTTDTYDRPILTVDVVLLALLEDKQLYVALAPRASEPFKDALALPGGYVHTDVDTSTISAAQRILAEKLGFSPAHLEQAFTESGPDRDPRGWSASVVYLALHTQDALKPLCDDGRIVLYPVQDLPDLAFDHARLIDFGVRRLRYKAEYTSIVAQLLPEQFTIPQLHWAFQAVTGTEINSANFRHQILKSKALVEADIIPTTSRPAQGYRLAQPVTDFKYSLVR